MTGNIQLFFNFSDTSNITILLCSSFEPYQVGTFSSTEFSNILRTVQLITDNNAVVFAPHLEFYLTNMNRVLANNNQFFPLFNEFFAQRHNECPERFIDLSPISTGLTSHPTPEVNLFFLYIDYIRHLYLVESFQPQVYQDKIVLLYSWLVNEEQSLLKNWHHDIIEYVKRKIPD
jgi:hypothetical protein